MKRGSLLVVGTYAIAWFVINVFRSSLPILLPELRTLYDIGFTDAGFIFASLFAGLALMQFPSGVIADTVGDRRVVFVSLVGSSLLLSSFGFATTVPVLLTLAFLFGAALGGFRAVAISSVTKVVRGDERNSALGLVAAGNPLGNFLGPFLTASAIIGVGVVWMPIIFGGVGVVVAIGIGSVLLRVGDETTHAEIGVVGVRGFWSETQRRGRLLVRTVSTSTGVSIVIASMAFSMTWQSIFTFLPTYLVEVRNLELAGTGLLTGVTFGVGILANVGAGRTADRVGGAIVLLVGFCIGAASILTLRVVETLPLAVAALVGLGLSFGAIAPVRDAFISRLAVPSDRGSVVGGVRTVYILLASGGTVFAGFVIEHTGFDGAFLLFAGTLAVGALAAFVLYVTVPVGSDTIA